MVTSLPLSSAGGKIMDNLRKCRLCLSDHSSVNIFQDEEGSDVPLHTKIIMCIALAVTPDSLPQSICVKCYNLINVFYEFRKKCYHTQVQLQNDLETREDTLKPVSGSFNPDVTNAEKSLEATHQTALLARKQPMQCSECCRTFKSPALLKKHFMVHSGERPHACKVCGHRFRLIGQLKFHLKIHSGESPYQCDVCKKVLLRPSDLAKHRRKHTGERPFSCEICNKKFSQLCGLRIHSRLHTNDRPYKCSFCTKSFIQLVNKTKHERIHKDGKRPYVCDVPHCGRSFIDLLEQELHRAGHDGGRPRKCDHCDQGFRTPSQLRDHTRRFHTDERPFVCPVCSKRFRESHALKLHSIVHTSLKPFCCTLCPQTFSQAGNYKRHLHARHAQDDDQVLFPTMSSSLPENVGLFY